MYNYLFLEILQKKLCSKFLRFKCIYKYIIKSFIRNVVHIQNKNPSVELKASENQIQFVIIKSFIFYLFRYPSIDPETRFIEFSEFHRVSRDSMKLLPWRPDLIRLFTSETHKRSLTLTHKFSPRSPDLFELMIQRSTLLGQVCYRIGQVNWDLLPGINSSLLISYY